MTRPIQLHVHSFGLRFRFKHHPDFDVFAYMRLAVELGFTGVNVSANGPSYRDLGGTTEQHFANVNACRADLELGFELDTSDTSVPNLNQMLDVTAACGGDTLRVYTRYQGTLEELKRWTIADLGTIAPKAADLGIIVVLENHEDFQGDAIAEIVGEVDSPAVRALYDYGNSQMVAEDPMAALEAMAPAISRVHMKDHVIVDHDGQPWVQGVPMGEGRLPIAAQTDRLYELGVRRFCYENVWAYVAAVVGGAERLPTGGCWSRHHDHRYLDGRSLPPADAVAGEWEAFERANHWLRQMLNDGGYRITPRPDAAPPSP